MKEQTQKQLREAGWGIIVVVGLILFVVTLRGRRPQNVAASLPLFEQRDTLPFGVFGYQLADSTIPALDSSLSVIPKSLLSLSQDLHNAILLTDSAGLFVPDSLSVLSGAGSNLGFDGELTLVFNGSLCDTIRFRGEQMTAHAYWEVLDALQEQLPHSLEQTVDSIIGSCYLATDSLCVTRAFYVNDGELGVPVIEYIRPLNR